MFSERLFLDFLTAPSSQDSQKCLLQIGDLSAKGPTQQSTSTSTENISDGKPITERTNNVQLDQVRPLSVRINEFVVQFLAEVLVPVLILMGVFVCFRMMQIELSVIHRQLLSCKKLMLISQR